MIVNVGDPPNCPNEPSDCSTDTVGRTLKFPMIKRAKYVSMQQRGKSLSSPIPQPFHLNRIQLRIPTLHLHVFDCKEGTCQDIQPEPAGIPRINVLNSK